MAPSPTESTRRPGPTERFSGLAETYARYRPSYPRAAVDYVLATCRLGRGSLLVDVGCGTGISSRLFAARGLRVIGIEPNDDMRTRAQAEPAAPDMIPPSFLAGRAEATGLAASSADAVLAAQSFHWFEPAIALAEFHRILRPGGWITLLWNERDRGDPFSAGYNRIIETMTDAVRYESPRRDVGEVLQETPLFEALAPAHFPNEQVLDEDGLLGRAFSASYAPRDPRDAEAFADALLDLFRTHAREGQVVLRYRTDVYLARRRELRSAPSA